MSDSGPVKISQLPAAASLNPADLFPIVQGGITKEWSNAAAGGLVFTVENIAALEALTFPSTYMLVATEGYYTRGDGGAGTYWANLTDTTTANGGTVIAPNAGGTGRWNLLYSQILANQWGCKHDGATDDSGALIKALNFANGDPVYLGPGVYYITSPLSGTTSTRIRLVGNARAYLNGNGMNSAVNQTGSNYTLFTPSDIPDQTVIECYGCNLIGAPDTSGAMNAWAVGGALYLQNLVLWGANAADAGVYMRGSDVEIVDCSLVLFESWGLHFRASTSVHIDRVAFWDCGWNLAGTGSGTAVPPTYYSGCAIKLTSNITAQDYTTINSSYKGAVFNIGETFHNTRSDTNTNKSGLRGIQASGTIDLRVSGWGAYTGSYLNQVGPGLVWTGGHIENYGANGFAAADALPYPIYARDTIGLIAPGYCAQLAGIAYANVYRSQSGTAGVGWWGPTVDSYGRLSGMTPVVPNINPIDNTIADVSGGGTATFTISNFARSDSGYELTGFFGFLAISLVKQGDASQWTSGVRLIGSWKAGGSGWQAPTSQTIGSDVTSTSGTNAVGIGTPTWSSGTLSIPITFGSAFTGASHWRVMLAPFGNKVISLT